MEGTHLIEVVHKPSVMDPVGHGLLKGAAHIVKGVKKIESAQLFRLVGKVGPEDLARIGRELLADPVIQTYQDGAAPEKMPKKGKSDHVTVDIWFKSGVTDVVGESVLKGIRDLNVDGVHEVRTGMRYRFYGLQDAAQAEKVVLALLVNPLIQDRFIHAG